MEPVTKMLWSVDTIFLALKQFVENINAKGTIKQQDFYKNFNMARRDGGAYFHIENLDCGVKFETKIQESIQERVTRH